MDLKDLAHRQLADYDRREPGGLFTGNLLSLTIEDAYALQVEVARLRQERGERIAGYKVGCVSQVMQNQLGLDRPVFGHVFATEVHAPDAVLDPGGFAGLAIEGELAVRIGKDVPDANWIGQHPAEVIFSAFPVIELHNYIFRNDPHTAQELIGNNAIHAGVVMPGVEPPLTDPALVQDIPITVSINGAVLGTSSGRALPGGPLASVVRLAEHLAKFGRSIRAGEIVLTGSPLPLYRVGAGDRIEVTSGGSIAVRARIAGP